MRRSTYKKGSCLTDKLCDYWYPPSCVFHKRGQCREGVKGPLFHLTEDSPAASAKRAPEGDKVKDLSAIAKQAKPWGNSLQEFEMDEEHIHAKGKPDGRRLFPRNEPYS